MLLKDSAAKIPGRKVEIVATDISSDALAKARKGVYSQFEVQRGLPVTHLVKYFAKHGDEWQISPEIRAMVDYREFNLLHPIGGLGQFVQFAAGRTYRNVEASRAPGPRLPPGTPVHGKLANGLALENRIKPIFVGRGFGSAWQRVPCGGTVPSVR